ncbi:MAG TPA: 16S rRNA (guanine(527)-N(7))-methyltransferase RsmG [Terriglobia bacterium]|nr:16S rRNA (guanine(527)-N(7))-methyltransferase RsmG [Terriglobia bacterium]
MLGQSEVNALLEPFELKLSSGQIGQMLVYLELLLRWNPKINLTSIRSPEEMITRHFGESLYLARWVQLKGKLLDIGSGAGFPGLALKIAFPELEATLLEPVGKKRAFLKEVVRACEFKSVEVRSERLDEFVHGSFGAKFGAVTTRAVGDFKHLIPEALEVMDAESMLYLWVGRKQGIELKVAAQLDWKTTIEIPVGREREIWMGRRKKT